MKKIKIIFILFFISIITSCNFENNIKENVPKNVKSVINDFTLCIQNGEYDNCFDLLNSELRNENVRNYLISLNSQIQNSKLDSFNIVGYKKKTFFNENTSINYGLDYEFVLENKYLFITFLVNENNDKLTINAFNASVNDESIVKENFSLENKSFLHYMFLFFAIIIPIFIIITLIFAIKSKLNRKWLWIIGILFGLIKFSINWDSGISDIDIINFQIFSAGFSRTGIASPWIVSFSIPVFAILFWYIRQKNLKSVNDKNSLES